MTGGLNPALARLIAGHIFLHACMAGTRMAAPLLALARGPQRGGRRRAAGAVCADAGLPGIAGRALRRPARAAAAAGLARVCAATAGAGLAVAFPVFPVLCLSALADRRRDRRGVDRAAAACRARGGQLRPSSSRCSRWLAIGPAVSNFLGPFSAGLVIDHGGFRLRLPADGAAAAAVAGSGCGPRRNCRRSSAPQAMPRAARLGPAARADVPPPAAGELVPVVLLGRAHLRAAGAGPRARPLAPR